MPDFRNFERRKPLLIKKVKAQAFNNYIYVKVYAFNNYIYVKVYAFNNYSSPATPGYLLKIAPLRLRLVHRIKPLPVIHVRPFSASRPGLSRGKA